MLALKKGINLSFNNPAVAIAAGIALTALGSALKNIKFNAPGFATGGMVSGPRSGYPVMLHGTELIVPLSEVGNMMGDSGTNISGELSLVARGEDLRYALAINNQKRGRR
jgi:hypothetical protein